MSSVRERDAPTRGRRLALPKPRLSVVLPRWPTTRPHRWGDPALVGVVAFVVYALHGYDGVLDRDLGVFTYGGLRISHGGSPYVDIFNSVGPLSDAVPGLAIWLGHFVGADPILSARLLLTVISAACCALLCVLARDTLGSRAAGYMAPAVFLTFGGFLRLASDGPREKTTMVLFLLACLILLGRRRWFWAGSCAALATLAWQPVLAVAVAALVAAALLDEQETRRRILLRFTIGGLVPSLVTVVYFLAVGALSQALDGFLVINAKYAEQPSLLTSSGWIAPKLWSAYRWTLPVAILGLIVLVALGMRAIRLARRPTVSTQARRQVGCAAGALVGTAWTVMVVNGGPDLFVLLPFAALGVAALAMLLLDRLPSRAALAGAVAVVLVGLMVAGHESVTTRNDDLIFQRADVDAVLGTQPPDATVLSLNAPQVLALSGRTNPTPYQIITATQERYLAATYPGGLAGFVGYLDRVDPTFVVVGDSVAPEWAKPWLTADYWSVGHNNGFRWYVNRSAGRDALLRAREAHDQVMAAYDRHLQK